MVHALKNALREKNLSEKSLKVNESHLNQFVKFIKEEHKVPTLNHITQAHVHSFASQLSDRHETGEISASTAQNQIAAVNSALSQARQDNTCVVHAVKDAHLPSRTHVATHDKSLSQPDHDALKASVSERLGCQLELQRELGLRFKESSLINAKSTLKQAEDKGVIRVDAGTKGGRFRDIPITSPAQIDALRSAAAVQGDHHSLVPKDMSFAEYQRDSYQAINGTNTGFHAERHAYANDRYHQITGAQSPVRAGENHGKDHIQYLSKELNIPIDEAKAIDAEARLQVSQELGHARISISNNYLG